MTIKKPVFIPVNEEGLDDLFIWKHKIEKSLGMTSHMLYGKFINDSLKLGEVTFYDWKTKEAVPFSIADVNGEKAVFYVPTNDKAVKEFFNAMEKCEYDITKFPLSPVGPYEGDVEAVSFFTDHGKMRPVV